MSMLSFATGTDAPEVSSRPTAMAARRQR